MWPYFTVPLEDHRRQVWLYVYMYVLDNTFIYDLYTQGVWIFGKEFGIICSKVNEVQNILPRLSESSFPLPLKDGSCFLMAAPRPASSSLIKLWSLGSRLRLHFPSSNINGAYTFWTAWYNVLSGESIIEETTILLWRLSGVIASGRILKNTITCSLSSFGSTWNVH